LYSHLIFERKFRHFESRETGYSCAQLVQHVTLQEPISVSDALLSPAAERSSAVAAAADDDRSAAGVAATKVV
jgi:hypothetical protein